LSLLNPKKSSHACGQVDRILQGEATTMAARDITKIATRVAVTARHITVAGNRTRGHTTLSEGRKAFRQGRVWWTQCSILLGSRAFLHQGCPGAKSERCSPRAGLHLPIVPVPFCLKENAQKLGAPPELGTLRP